MLHICIYLCASVCHTVTLGFNQEPLTLTFWNWFSPTCFYFPSTGIIFIFSHVFWGLDLGSHASMQTQTEWQIHSYWMSQWPLETCWHCVDIREPGRRMLGCSHLCSGDSHTATISLGRNMFTNDGANPGDKTEGESSQIQTRGHGQ